MNCFLTFSNFSNMYLRSTYVKQTKESAVSCREECVEGRQLTAVWKLRTQRVRKKPCLAFSAYSLPRPEHG